MFDTSLFNCILDGVIANEALTGDVVARATHIQLNEINKGSGIEVVLEGRERRETAVASSIPAPLARASFPLRFYSASGLMSGNAHAKKLSPLFSSCLEFSFELLPLLGAASECSRIS
jgi:hypothetical protein